MQQEVSPVVIAIVVVVFALALFAVYKFTLGKKQVIPPPMEMMGPQGGMPDGGSGGPAGYPAAPGAPAGGGGGG